jgi:hypothetical protein
MSELHSLLLRTTDYGIVTLGPTTVAWIDRERLIAVIIDRPHVSVAMWWSSLQLQGSTVNASPR